MPADEIEEFKILIFRSIIKVFRTKRGFKNICMGKSLINVAIPFFFYRNRFAVKRKIAPKSMLEHRI